MATPPHQPGARMNREFSAVFQPKRMCPLPLAALLAATFLAAFGHTRVQADEVPIFATGKVSVENREVSINIQSARHRDGGGGLNDLTGKSLKVTETSASSLERLAGKEVSIRGSVRDGSELEVVWVGVREERKTPSESGQTRGQSRSSGAVRSVGVPIGSVQEQGQLRSDERTRNVDERTGRPASERGATGTRRTHGAIGSVGAINSPSQTSSASGRTTTGPRRNR